MAATLLQLRTRVRRKSNTENNAFVLDEEIDEFINEACKRAWRKLLTIDEMLVAGTADFTLASSSQVVQQALPADFWRAIGLDRYPDTDQVEAVRVFNFADRNRLGCVSYRIHGNVLIVEPRTEAAGTYRLYYTPDFSALTLDASTLPVALDRFDEFIVVAASISVKDKRDQDTRALLTALQMLEKEIGPVAQNRQSEQMRAPAPIRYSGLPGFDGGDDPARGPR